jgi:putative tricarboxylic transport membrane protein
MTTVRSLRLGEAVLGGAVLALGLFVAFETTGLRVPAGGGVGPTLFPFLIAAGLVVIGVLLLYEAFRGHIAHEGGLELDWIGVGLVSAGLIAQLLLLERAGWVLATALLFVAAARAFGSRRLVADAAVGLVLAGLSFVVFTYGLDLSLPGGDLGALLAPEEAAE